MTEFFFGYNWVLNWLIQHFRFIESNVHWLKHSLGQLDNDPLKQTGKTYFQFKIIQIVSSPNCSSTIKTIFCFIQKIGWSSYNQIPLKDFKKPLTAKHGNYIMSVRNPRNHHRFHWIFIGTHCRWRYFSFQQKSATFFLLRKIRNFLALHSCTFSCRVIMYIIHLSASLFLFTFKNLQKLAWLLLIKCTHMPLKFNK